jgi:N-acetyl-1-D-myo-inositol-2-amino-2-deoxy-alpha-D-glucopyranoside deacetylase
MFEGIGDADDVPSVVSDDEVAAAVDGLAHAGAKADAMRAHATQITVDFPYFALSNMLGQQVLGVEYYRLARGERGPAAQSGPAAEHGWEDDLFAGLPG